METGEEDSHISEISDRIDIIQEEFDIILKDLFEKTDIEDKELSVSKSKNEIQDDYLFFKDEESANDKSSSTLFDIDSDDLPLVLYGRNHYEWSTKMIGSNEIISSPIYRLSIGKGQRSRVRNPLKSWALFMTDEMLFKIVIHTNEQIFNLNKNAFSQTYNKYTDLQEIKAFIGLLYFLGLQGNTRLNVESLWSSLVSPIYRMTMSSNRFIFLLGNITFDDKSTRSTYKSTDKLAPIRELWDQLIHNCSKYYEPGENCTIDVQSLRLNRPRSFRIHDFDDSDKMEIIMLNDSDTFYMYNALPVIETPVVAAETIGSYYLRVLCEPLYGSGRNIICDNHFTSVPIVDKMIKDYNLTVVGTIKKDEPEIPICMTEARAKGTSIYAYNDNKTLVSFCPKENRIVLFLSSLPKVGGMYKISKMNIPGIIEYYNIFKDASDMFTQMCELYTTARHTPCWSLRFFYAMLDISGINSYILYQLNKNNISKSCYIFLEEVAGELIKPLLCEKLSITALQSERYMIKNILKNLTAQQEESIHYKSNNCVRCNFCVHEKCRTMKYICPTCKKLCCKDHRLILCVNCALSKL